LQVHDAIELIDGSLVQLDAHTNPVEGTAHAVWQLNQLRKLLGWIVLQWAASMSTGPAPAQSTAPAIDAYIKVDSNEAPTGVQSTTGESKPLEEGNSPASQHTPVCSDVVGELGKRAGAGTESAFAPCLVDSYSQLETNGSIVASIAESDAYIPTGLVARRVAIIEATDPSSSLHSHKLSDTDKERAMADIPPTAEQGVDSRDAAINRLSRPSLTISLSQTQQPAMNLMSPRRSSGRFFVLVPAINTEMSSKFQ
jgi:hypothetical protein